MKLKELLPLIVDSMEIDLWEEDEKRLCYATSTDNEKLQSFLEREISKVYVFYGYYNGKININVKKIS